MNLVAWVVLSVQSFFFHFWPIFHPLAFHALKEVLAGGDISNVVYILYIVSYYKMFTLQGFSEVLILGWVPEFFGRFFPRISNRFLSFRIFLEELLPVGGPEGPRGYIGLLVSIYL